jgi:hypothetical protein
MAYPAYVREKARELRIERRLSIVEIAERLALPKTTVFYWVRDIPLGRPRRAHADQNVGQLTCFWGEVVGVDPSEIGLQRKSNSNQLRKRTWSSQHGVLTCERATRSSERGFRAGWIAWRRRGYTRPTAGRSEAWLSRGLWVAETVGSNPAAPINSSRRRRAAACGGSRRGRHDLP